VQDFLDGGLDAMVEEPNADDHTALNEIMNRAVTRRMSQLQGRDIGAHGTFEKDLAKKLAETVQHNRQPTTSAFVKRGPTTDFLDTPNIQDAPDLAFKKNEHTKSGRLSVARPPSLSRIAEGSDSAAPRRQSEERRLTEVPGGSRDRIQ